MYLVHTELLNRKEDLCIPQDLALLLRALAHPDDGVEHVVVHPRAGRGLTVGVYLLSERLRDAEETAARLCGRAVAGTGPLPGWRVGRSEAPLLAPYGLDGLGDLGDLGDLVD
ncbi:hypothetical protein [Streptomyces sp. NPDC003327]